MAMFKTAAMAAAAATFAGLAAAEFACKDVTEENDPNCYGHIVWAMEQGQDAHPDWYPAGTLETAVDMQCALFLKVGGHVDGNSHNCTMPPCANISSNMSSGGDPDVLYCSPPVQMAEVEKPGPSIEWWGYVLIAAAVIGLGVLAAYALGLFGAKKPKKKRAVKVEAAPAPEEAPLIAPPIYTYAQQPTSVVTAPPVYTYASQPTTLLAADLNHDGVIESNEVFAVQPASQPVYYAQPATYVQPAAARSVLFAADLNHDGVIESNEVFAGTILR